MSMMKLPPELLLEVLEHSENDKTLLKNLCLVNSLFHDEAQKVLFETVTLSGKLEKAKRKVEGLKGSNRLVKYIRTLEIRGSAILSEDELHGEEDLPDNFIEQLAVHAQEFMASLVPFFQALKGNKLKIWIDAPDEDFEGWLEVEPYLAVFVEAVVLSLGCVEMQCLHTLCLNYVGANLLNRFDGERCDFFLPTANITSGFEKSLLVKNMAGLKEMYMGHSSEWEGASPQEPEACTAMFDFIGLRPWITTVNLAICTEIPLSLAPLDGETMTALSLQNMCLAADGLIEFLSSTTTLSTLNLQYITLDWNPENYYGDDGDDGDELLLTWESVFDACSSLPLKSLGLACLHSEFCHVGDCYTHRPEPVLITERADDIYAMRALGRQVLASGGGLKQGHFLRKVNDVNDIPVCLHTAGGDPNYGTSCPKKPPPKKEVEQK